MDKALFAQTSDPEPFGQTINLSLPPAAASGQYGGTQDFWLAGQAKSAAINDGKIQAVIPGSNGNKHPAGDVKLTVFYFDQPVLKITPVGTYQYKKGQPFTHLWPTGHSQGRKHNVSVRFTVSARLEPPGLMAEYSAAPALKYLKVGMVQNALAGTKDEDFYKFSRVKWLANAQRGSTVLAPKTYEPYVSLTQNVEDTGAGGYPLYPQINPTRSVSVLPGATFKSTDAPDYEDFTTRTFMFPFTNPTNPPTIGGRAVVHYNLKNMTMNNSLDDWCVIVKQKVVMDIPAQNSWSVSESKTHLAKATTNSQGPVTTVLVIKRPRANAIGQGPQNNPQPYSTATTTLTKQ